jgi:ABC-2 type transport system permease protein
LSFGWRFLVSTLGFWVADATGYARLAYFFVLFPSGFAVPLAFMPPWLQALCNLTPFPSIINTPVEIYLGHVRGAEALTLIGAQIVWLAVLIALGRLAAEAGRRKLTIQGG